VAATVVQRAGNDTYYGGTSLSTTLGATPTVGNTLVLVASGMGASPHTVTGPSGWTAGPSANNYDFIGIWTKVAGASESTTVTTTFVTNLCCIMLVYEIAGLTGSIDKSATCGTLGTGITSLPSGTTATLAQATELAVVGATFAAAAGDLITARSGGYVRQDERANLTAHSYLDVGFLSTASTAAQSCTLTLSPYDDGPAAIIATFPLVVSSVFDQSLIRQQAVNRSYTY